MINGVTTVFEDRVAKVRGDLPVDSMGHAMLDTALVQHRLADSARCAGELERSLKLQEAAERTLTVVQLPGEIRRLRSRKGIPPEAVNCLVMAQNAIHVDRNLEGALGWLSKARWWIRNPDFSGSSEVARKAAQKAAQKAA